MEPIPLARAIFAASAIYDLLLGVAFSVFPVFIFSHFQLPAPGHWGYVQFPAALLIVFAVMFLDIARDPVSKYALIPYGAMLKLAYMAVVFGHWFLATVPDLWKPFAIIDAVFLVGFIWGYSRLRPRQASV